MKHKRAIRITLSIVLVLALLETLLALASGGFNSNDTGHTDTTSYSVAVIAFIVAIICIVGLVAVYKRSKRVN